MMDSSQKLEYLNRDSIKKFSGWKNYSPNVWNILHWKPELLEAADKADWIGTSRKNRPSTAPPKRFGLKYNPKNEIPTKVSHLMENMEDMQHQILRFKKTIAQQNILIDNLTSCVENLSVQQTKASDTENKAMDGSANILKIDDIPFDNEEKNEPKKESIVEEIIAAVQPPKQSAKDKKPAVATYFAVDSKEIKANKKKSKSQKGKVKKTTKAVEKGIIKRKRARINKPITPRVVKSNKITRKQIKL